MFFSKGGKGDGEWQPVVTPKQQDPDADDEMIISRVGKQPGRAVTQTGQEPASLAWAQCPQLCLTLATEDRAWEEPDLSLPFVQACPSHRGQRTHGTSEGSGRDSGQSRLGRWVDRPLSVSLGQQAGEADVGHDSEGIAPLPAVQK